MKNLLIISPYFPPSNAADMQRIRTSLPYFKKYGWEVTVVAVDEQYSDINKDNLLLKSIPDNITVLRVRAFNKQWTSRLGLGSIALRSLWFYFRRVNSVLKNKKFDLVYFSTTQFPVCILGAYWRRYFGVPYVIDMQDPWHSDYYKDKPKDQRPAKYWFSYRLNKYLEPIAMKRVSGLIAVSESYILNLKSRYPGIQNIPASTITFGAFDQDIKIANESRSEFPALLEPGLTNVVYVGRGGADFYKSLTPLFDGLKMGLRLQPKLFEKFRFYFIGTSYAPAGKGVVSILPLAKQLGVEQNVLEITDRISYYHAMLTLQDATALFIPGSDDPQYTASKIYPYLMMQKPLIAIFNEKSSALELIKNCTENAVVLGFSSSTEIVNEVYQALGFLANGLLQPAKITKAFEEFSADMLTMAQVKLFNQTLGHAEKKL